MDGTSVRTPETGAFLVRHGDSSGHCSASQCGEHLHRPVCGVSAARLGNTGMVGRTVKGRCDV